MKLSELKLKFKNKYMIRIVAGVLVVTMIGTGASAASAQAAGNRNAAAKTVAEATEDMEDDTSGADVESGIEGVLGNTVPVNADGIGKDETVYIIADSTGNAKEMIVSDHLTNKGYKETIEDVSELENIENIKGGETFEKDGDRLVWQADGNDIYYQGTAEKQLPVTQEITYYLDGNEISPQELAGKSGKVTIRFDYVNHEKTQAKIAGKAEDIYVPFLAVSGVILNENFRNIEVTNGRVSEDGSRSVVIGYALPGLKDSLKVEEKDFNSEVKIPDYVEITADVENFELGMTMTAVVNATDYLSSDGDSDKSSVADMVDTLTDAADRLQDGSAELADGVDTLKDSLGDFSDGMKTLKDGIASYTGGASTLSGGIGTLKNGVDALAGNVPALTSGVAQLKSGADSAAAGAETLKGGTADLKSGAGELAAGANALLEGAGALSSGATDLSAGVNTLTGKLQEMGTGLAAAKTGVYDAFQSSAGMSYDDAAQALQSLKALQAGLVQGITAETQAAGLLTAGDAEGAQAKVQEAQGYYGAVQQGLGAIGMNVEIQNAAVAANVMAQLGETIANLQAGMAQVDGAVGVIDNVSGQLQNPETAAQIAALSQGAGALASGAKELETGVGSVAAGANALSAGADQVAAGASALSDGLNTLDAGLNTLNQKAGALGSGAAELKKGTDQLAAGASTLVSNNASLNDGATKLFDGTGAIVSGVSQLSDGAHELADGIVTFNEEGIEKILNAYNGDIQPLMERIQAVLDAGKEYQTYSGIAQGVNGSVKFVYKTDAIKTEVEISEK